MSYKDGLYEKYYVERNDGTPILGGCIVLEWKDPNGREGIVAFSYAVRQAGYTKLADDLDSRLRQYEETGMTPRELQQERDEALGALRDIAEGRAYQPVLHASSRLRQIEGGDDDTV